MIATALVRVAAATLLAVAADAHADAPASVRVYAFDCGRLHFNDFGEFADTGEYDGKPGDLVATCFLIRHPKGDLLWDAGVGDAYAKQPAGVDKYGAHITAPVTFASQLEQLAVKPDDVEFVAFSHLHFDHTGNANLFAQATWLLDPEAIAAAERSPPPPGVDPATFSAYKTARTQRIAYDHDVFGDGSVRILKTPGHTRGHQALLLTLKKTGTVILSGDLWHTRTNLEHRRMPGFNDSRADTLASMDRIEVIARRTKARIVVQHDPADIAALPKPPAYLD